MMLSFDVVSTFIFPILSLSKGFATIGLLVKHFPNAIRIPRISTRKATVGRIAGSHTSKHR